jgi:hypothetical protein
MALLSHVAPLLSGIEELFAREGRRGRSEHREEERAMDGGSEDFARLDDSALLRKRMEMRAELERLPSGSLDYAALLARYDRSTEEINDRARRAWSRAN